MGSDEAFEGDAAQGELSEWRVIRHGLLGEGRVRRERFDCGDEGGRLRWG